MHRIFLLCTLIAVSSCGGDDVILVSPNNNSANALFIKKVVHNSYLGNGELESTLESNYFYSNFRLIRKIDGPPSDSNSFRSEFSYTGDKLTEVKYYENNATAPYANTVLEYDGNAIKYVHDLSAYQRKEFVYEANKLIKNVYGAALNETEPTVLVDRYEYSLSAGNVMSEYLQIGIPIGLYSGVNANTFDDKNNPMNGLSPYYRQAFGGLGFDGYSTNNVLTTATFQDGVLVPTYEYEYDYNSNNYPTQIRKYYTQTHVLISQTDIEYY